MAVPVGANGQVVVIPIIAAKAANTITQASCSEQMRVMDLACRRCHG